MKLTHAIFLSALSLTLLAPSAKEATAAKSGPAEPKAGMAPGVYAKIYTSKGVITGQLEFEKTPVTVANFVGLAEGTKAHNRSGSKRFYDGLTFHRVIPNFMIQGGDPQGNGSGGPGYQFEDEFDPSLKHDRAGIFSMANSGRATNGSQFFITHGPTSWLDGKHSVFGAVVEGQDVVNAIQGGDVIDSVRIERVGAKATAFVVTEARFQELMKGRAARDEAKAKAAVAAEAKLLADQSKGAKQTPSGLRYIVRQEGKGPKPVAGTTIKAHYSGRLLDGKKFDSSYDRGQPFSFQVGSRQVIAGWDEALLDMRKGEKRTLWIPANLGYGNQDMGVIPPNSTLVFEVELVDF